jgi:hypothetical protein
LEEITAAAIERVEANGTIDWVRIPEHEILLLYGSNRHASSCRKCSVSASWAEYGPPHKY